MTKSIFEYPEIPMSIVTGLVFAALVAVGIIAAKRWVHPRIHSDANDTMNDVIDKTLAVFSAFYAILLGLLAVGAYENINDVEGVVGKEAAAISVLYWNSTGFPEPTHSQIHDALRAYLQQVVDHSFDEQSHGVRPTGERPMLEAMSQAIVTFKPQTRAEESIQTEALRQLSDLQEARHIRLDSSSVGIPSVLWWIVGLGAAINLLLVCLLEFPLRSHLVFGCLLAFYIGAMIYVIASMDNPFSGSDRVGADAFEQLLNAKGLR